MTSPKRHGWLGAVLLLINQLSRIKMQSLPFLDFHFCAITRIVAFPAFDPLARMAFRLVEDSSTTSSSALVFSIGEHGGAAADTETRLDDKRNSVCW